MATYRWVDDLSHLRADCLYTWNSSGPTLGNEYGKPLPFYIAWTHTGVEKNGSTNCIPVHFQYELKKIKDVSPWFGL